MRLIKVLWSEHFLKSHIFESLQSNSSHCCPNLGHFKRKWTSPPTSFVSQFLQIHKCLGSLVARISHCQHPTRHQPRAHCQANALSSEATSLTLSTIATEENRSLYNTGWAIIYISGYLAECWIPCFNGVFIYVAQSRVPLIVVPPHIMPQM